MVDSAQSRLADMGFTFTMWNQNFIAFDAGVATAFPTAAANDLRKFALDGSPSVLEEVVYSDNQLVEVLLNEPLSGTVSTSDFSLRDEDGIAVSGISLNNVSLINGNRTILFELDGRSETEDIIIRRESSQLIGSSSGMAMGLVVDVATIPAFDPEVPRIVTASFTDNSRVVMEFSDDVYAVSTDDFILQVLNPDRVSGAEVSRLTHPAVGGAGGAPSRSVVALDLNTTVTGALSQGRESLRIRLARNYVNDISAFYTTLCTDVALCPGELGQSFRRPPEPKRSATHQIQTDELPFESADAPRLTTAEVDATNTTLTLTFDRGVDYVGSDAAADFTFAVNPGPARRTHRITTATATAVVMGASSNTIAVGLETDPAGGRSTAGEDRGTITIARDAIVNRSSTDIRISRSRNSLAFNFRDTEAPAVAGIEGVDAAGNSASRAELNNADNTYTARWQVTFTEPVSGPAATDFLVCRGDGVNGASTRCETVVSTGNVTVSGSGFRETWSVTESGLAQAAGSHIDYLLRFDAGSSGIQDQASRSLPASATAEGGVQTARDTIAPQVTEVSISTDNRMLTITFSEAISRRLPGNNSFALSRVVPERSTTDGEFSEWVLGLDISNPGSPQAANGDTTYTFDIRPTGPAPLNGASPDGIEVFSVRVAEDIVEDAVGTNNAEGRMDITLNETAAPQIRAGDGGFRASNVELVAGDEVNITWRVRFTETVRNVATTSFTLLEVDTAAGTSRSYTGATYATGDSFALGDTTRFRVVTASGARTTGGGQYADTYEVTTDGLRLFDNSNNLLSYALRMTAATPAVKDDDTAAGRDLAGLPRTTPVRAASNDNTAPVLSDARLDATNTTLTLTFTDEDSVRYTGSDFAADFTLTGVSNLAPGGMRWITTVAAAAAPVLVSSQTLELRIATQGPPPLNGGSARGGEVWRVAIAASAISDRSNNRLAAGSSDTFMFNDNANPAIQEIAAQRLQSSTDVRWTVVFTEPVENVDAADFTLYRFNTAAATAPGNAVEQADLDSMLNVGASADGTSYTLTTGLPEAAGEDRYYALATTQTNNIQKVGDPGQPLQPRVQAHPDFGAGIYTHEDLTPPTVTTGTTAVSSDNSRITITFSENIRLTADDASFVAQVGVTTGVAGGGIFLTAADRTAVLNEWITAVPTVSSPVVSGNRLTLNLGITGPPPLNGAVPINGPGYLVITLPPLIADVVGGQPRNNLVQTDIAATLNNAARPHVLEVAATTINEAPATGDYNADWRVRFTEPVQNVGPADFYLEMADDRDFTANVSTADDAAITVSSGADILREYTVRATVSGSVASSIFYRLRLAADATVEEVDDMPSADRMPVLPDGLVYGVHEAPDNVAPQVLTPAAGRFLGADNTTAVIVFSEAIGAVTTRSIVVRVVTPSDWITGAELVAASTDGDMLTLTVALSGPSPLNGDSADGGEVIEVRFPQNTVRDLADNGNAEFSRRFEVREEAAPRLRQFINAGAVLGESGITADLSWEIRFTETVRNVGVADFTLLSVPQGQPAENGTPYTGAEYSKNDDMTVAAAPQATSTTDAGGRVHYDRYTITVRGLTSTDVMQTSAAARYAIRLDTTASVADDDDRTWTPAIARHSAIQDAARDETAPEFISAALNADNTMLTLSFSEAVRYTGGNANADFMMTVAAGTAGQYRSVTGASVTAVNEAGTNTLVLTIRGQGPAPLNGLSAVGGEAGTITINRASVVDRGNNSLVAGGTNSDTFQFSDNAAPRLASAQLTATPAQTPGAATRVSWTMTFTEPVSGVDTADFRIYKLPAVDAALSAESGSPAIADLSPGVSGGEASYTLAVTIPEPVGEDAYYTVSLAAANNITGSRDSAAVPPEGREAPAAATSVATLRDLSPPVLVGAPVLSSDNGEITYTFNEGVQFAGTPADFAGLVAAARNTQGLTNLNGVNRVRVLQQAINDFSITAASVSGAEVRLRVSIDGTVTIPAPGYLQVTLPAGRIVDLPAGGTGGYGGGSHRFDLTDEAQPTIVETSATSITRDAADNLYDAEWRVSFSEPVDGVEVRHFSVCMVAAAADACSAGTVLTNAVNSVAAEADSDFRRYTVAARNLAQLSGPTWYRLRVNNTAGIVERLRTPGRALTGLPHTAPAHRADDTIGPVAQAGGRSIISTSTTARLTVPFNEALGALDRNRISVALAAPQSEWITGAEVSGAAFDAATLTVTVTTTGPSPLNGLSPDGGEGLVLTLGQGAVSDGSGNPGAAADLSFTLRENAAPQVRAGGITGQSGEVMVNGGDRTAVLEWRVAFTETVRGVTSASFTLLRVTGTQPAIVTNPVDFVGGVTTASGSAMTGGGAFAETYTVRTTVAAGPPGSPARYILAFSDTGVEDDDTRRWSGAQFRSGVVSVDDRTPPQVVAAEATAAAQAGRITITVTFNEVLAASSISRIGGEFGGFADGVLQNPLADYVTVRRARLVEASGSGSRLVFIAQLSGSSLDGHESAVGVEQFTFTIPAGLVVDDSARNNATTMATPFTITLPESGAPEVAGFGVVSSEEDLPGSGSGVFDISYLVEFTEPVMFSVSTATAFVLYQVADRAATRIRPAPGSDVTVESGLSSPVRITATPTVETMMMGARHRVTYTGIRRPTSNVRGYVAFLDASVVADASNRALEDCSWRDGAASGCLSASADVSDTVPPRFASDQAAYGSGQDRLWVTFNEPISVPGGVEGSSLQGFTVNLHTPAGEEVAVNAARYRTAAQVNNSGSVELQLAGAVTAQTVYVTYESPSSGLAIHDDARARGLNDAPNRIAAGTTMTAALMLDAARDSDNDGVPDSVEARIGANPWATADNDPQAQNLPELTLTRGAGTAHIAYAGIRADGIFEHLGLSVTPAGARARTLAYYRDNCATEDLLSGNCTLVDFSNIPAAMDHRIAWVATNEAGYPVTAEQTIHRVPELNMANERLFFLAGEADASTLAVAATLDAPTAASLTLVVSPALTVSGLSGVVAKSDVGGTSQTYTIAGLTDSGGGDVLWRVASGTGALTASNYSLGVSSRTRVVRLGDDFLPPLLGRPRLTVTGGDERLGLTEGDFTVALDARYVTAAPEAVEVGAPSVLTSIAPAAFSAGAGEVSVSFTVPAGARSASKTSVSLRITVPGAGPSESSLLLTWPLVPAGNVLAGVTSDTDADGIPDNLGADRYTGDGALPVTVTGDGREAAGRAPWHHIRTGLPQHRMCVGGLTLRFAAAADNPFDSYDDWAASFSTPELETVGVPRPLQPLYLAYNFGVCGVDFDAAPRSSTDTTVVITGGRAVVVIPLPQNLHDDTGLGIYKYRRAANAWQVVAARSGDLEWGFVPLQNGVCPVTNEVPATSAKRAGDACLVVRIRDGGEYDGDGSINGVIEDPIGIRTGGSSGASGGGGGGGGSFGPFGLFAILISVAALLLRTRRRRVNA